MRYNEHGRYLIQRGEFKNGSKLYDSPKQINGIDDIIKFDYMGAAEYEFGELPRSLKRIVSFYRKGNLLTKSILIKEKEFSLFYNKETEYDVNDIIEVINHLANNEYTTKCKYSVKMMSHLSSYFEGRSTMQLKRGCKKKMEEVNNYNYCNFWWDVEHDWMLVPNELDYIPNMHLAFSALINKKFDIEKKESFIHKILGDKK